jgi:hypothetical protein
MAKNRVMIDDPHLIGLKDLKDTCNRFLSRIEGDFLHLLGSSSIFYGFIVWNSLPHLFSWTSLESQLECWCKCCFGCLSLTTCFCYGGWEPFHREDLKHFSSVLADHLDDNGILDVALSDKSVGLNMIIYVRGWQLILDRETSEPQRQRYVARTIVMLSWHLQNHE